MEKYDDIKVLKGLEGIQMRPGMYVGDTSTNEGLMNCFWEIVSNSFDEHLAGFGNLIKVHIHRGIQPWFVIKDFGRGIPNSWNVKEEKLNLELTFSHIHSGGKFDNDSNYTFSSGLHGVGASAVNALSLNFLCVSIRKDQSIFIKFYHGKVVNIRFHKGGKRTGTIVMFQPSQKYLLTDNFDEELMARKLFGLTHVSPKLKIILSKDQEKPKLIRSQGLMNLFEKNTIGLRNLLIKPLELRFENENGYVHIILNWYITNSNKTIAFTNGTEQNMGGTHVNQVMMELRKYFVQEFKWTLTNQELREGFFLAINLMIKDPQYSSQTKEKLTSGSARTLIKSTFENNKDILLIFQNELRKVGEYLRVLSKKRKEYLDVKIEFNKEGISLGSVMPGKLLDCLSKNLDENELFITEGDSAGATAKLARDRYYQAIIPIKGKIINVERSSIKKIFNFEAVKNLVNVLGTNIGKNFQYGKLRYGKIILMTDADSDGYQIQALLISLFYKFLPKVILKGHLYVALAPLFRLRVHGKDLFFNNRSTLEGFLFQNATFKEGSYDLFKEIIRELDHSEQSIQIVEIIARGKDIVDNLKRLFQQPFKILSNVNHWVLSLGYQSNQQMIVIRNNSIIKMLDLLQREEFVENLSNKIFKVLDLNKKDLTRFKGLGQMEYYELWDLVMDPVRRKLQRVTLHSSEEIYLRFNQIMGTDPQWRKHLIDSSELNLHDLDV